MAWAGRDPVARRSTWATVVYALPFAVAAAVIVAGGVVVQLPGALLVTDPREIVVSMGAALCGPIGGVVIGFAAGIFERIPGVALPSALGHAAAGLWMGWAFARIAASTRCRARPGQFLLAWAGALVFYYCGALYPVGLSASLLVPAVWSDPRYQGHNVVTALPHLLSDASIEFLFTLAFTAVAWWAIPKRLRLPWTTRPASRWRVSAGRRARTGQASVPDLGPAPDARCGQACGRTALLAGGAFGLAALVVLMTGLHVPLPGTHAHTDPRETFVLLASAVYGPLAAAMAGVLAGAKRLDPAYLTWSAGCHICAALWASWAYRRLASSALCRQRLIYFLAGWVGCVVVYYEGVLVPLAVLLARCHAALWAELFGPGAGLWATWRQMAGGVVPEMAGTCVLTATVLWALPRRHRWPLGWSTRGAT